MTTFIECVVPPGRKESGRSRWWVAQDLTVPDRWVIMHQLRDEEPAEAWAGDEEGRPFMDRRAAHEHMMYLARMTRKVHPFFFVTERRLAQIPEGMPQEQSNGDG